MFKKSILLSFFLAALFMVLGGVAQAEEKVYVNGIDFGFPPFGFVGKDGKREVRPGDLQIQVGGSSAAGPDTLVKKLTLTGQPLAPTYHFVNPVVN